MWHLSMGRAHGFPTLVLTLSVGTAKPHFSDVYLESKLRGRVPLHFSLSSNVLCGIALILSL
jgi:hypothetical protein